MTRNRLYLALTLLITTGYTWLIWALRQASIKHDFSPCPVKNITGIGCPSCGSTRSALALIHGDFTGALYINPLSFIIAIALIIMPLWLLYDLTLKKDTLFFSFKKAESIISKKWIAIILITLIIINWIWNIKKGI